jgi:hypothetical protein
MGLKYFYKNAEGNFIVDNEAFILPKGLWAATLPDVGEENEGLLSIWDVCGYDSLFTKIPYNEIFKENNSPYSSINELSDVVNEFLH